MIYPRPLVEIMGDIVTKTGTKVLEQIKAAQLAYKQIKYPEETVSDIQSVTYMFGHPKELIETLKQKDESPTGKFDKFPVVMLFTDIPEVFTGDNSGYYAEVTMQIIIANCTSADLTADEREASNFKPVLQPIYEELMKQIARSGFLVVENQRSISHTAIPRHFWGRQGLYGNEGNQFNDFIDAIEIKDLKLKVNNQK